MRKRIEIIIAILCVLLVCVACGNKENNNDNVKNTQSSEKNTENEVGDNHEESHFSQEFQWAGFWFHYPGNLELSTTDCGRILEYEKSCVFFEAPGASGVMYDVSDLNEAVSVCKEHVYDTLEGTIRSLFNHGNTEQIVNNLQEVEINEIKMLRVEGVFKNTHDNTSVPYVAYYFLGGPDNNRPVYAVGIPMDEAADVESFMDEFAKQIKKN